MEYLKVKITGMSCQHCSNAVANKAIGVEGVRIADVNLEKAKALISFEPEVTSKGKILDELRETHYTFEELEM